MQVLKPSEVNSGLLNSQSYQEMFLCGKQVGFWQRDLFIAVGLAQ